MSLIDFGWWGFFVPVTIGEIYGPPRINSMVSCGSLLLRPVAAQVTELKTLTVATHTNHRKEIKTMAKDRSFAHRLHQSNIDRQRNAAYFMYRQAATQPPAPKADFWQRTKAFFKGLWTKIKEIVND